MMNFRTLFFLLFAGLPVLAAADNYLVTVYGRLVDGGGNGIGNAVIYISQAPGSPFTVNEKVSTLPSGEFKWPVYIPDSIPGGVLLLGFQNCEGKEIFARFEFSKNKPVIEAKLIFCERPVGKPCASEVIAKKINDTLAIAWVRAKGIPPFMHQWTNGLTGDTIRFNPQLKIRICVVTKDSTGCKSEACVPGFNNSCGIYIEQDGRFLIAKSKEERIVSLLWSTGADGEKIEIKEPGEYCVKAVMASGCEAKACILVKPVNLDPCAAEIVAERLGSDNQDSTPGIRLQVKSGFDLKYILWSTGETTRTIVVRKSGEYCVSVSDNVRCKMYICKKVELGDDSCRVFIHMEKIPVTSNTDAGHKVRLTAKTTFKPNLYYWNTGDTTPSILVEKSGEYCVTVSNGVNCKTASCVKVDLPGPNISRCEASIVVYQKTTGELDLITKAAGKAPFTYQWITGSTDANITVKNSGKYCVTIKDAAGCTMQACVEVLFEKPSGGNLFPDADKIKLGVQPLAEGAQIQLNIHPNPTADRLVYQVNSKLSEAGQLSVMNLYGKTIYQEKIDVQDGLSYGQLDLSFLPPGVYMVNIHQQGFISSKKLIIER
ncbi:MAG TPA: T9SS type A sorting domain-containing protein [Saprospiraceae bacterium]|nr:T9SS type A sorting domain-containing protein [Saprospiraceae bacterium]HNT18783.1 T9SS type A sorting domain-containing protein [Saprospiraceae bacterium]